MFRIGKSVFGVAALVMAVCTLTVAVTLTVLGARAELKTITAGTQLFARETTSMAAVEMGGAIKFGKIGKLEESAFNLVANAGGQAIGGIVLSPENEVLVSTTDNESTVASLTSLSQKAVETGERQISPDGMMVAAPILFGKDNTVVGAFSMAFTPDAVIETAMDMLFVTILVSVGVFVACLGASILFLRSYLSKPLRGVKDVLAEMSAGHLDVDVPYQNRRDEIGAITSTIEEFRKLMIAAKDAQFEALFRGSAFSASSAAMMIVDRDFNIKVLNDAVKDLMRAHQDVFKQVNPDFDPEKLVGKSADLFHRNPAHNRKMLGGDITYPFKAAFEVGQSSFDLVINSVRDKDGADIGMVVEWSDVTETSLRDATMAALDREQFKADFLMDGKLSRANDLVEAFLGVENCEEGGVELWSLLVDDPNFAGPSVAEAKQAIEAAGSVSGRFVLNAPNGKRVIVEGSLNAVANKKGRLTRIVLLAKDVTEAQEALRRSEAERLRVLGSQELVVTDLTEALEQLSNGNLSVQLINQFDGDYEALRTNFNSALVNVASAINEVKVVSGSIRQEASEITNAADNLAQRTERSAATLEETAAALDLLTGSVQSAAIGAEKANELVNQAKVSAEQSGEVVRDAVHAMSEIETSSSQISKIITVIDDIAFQTNLLALNAGVEAARAGDAGRGFAVVASEVRALAQRSSDAAKEINTLISQSGSHVNQGVKLVDQAGEALEEIASAVKELSAHVAQIAESSHDQSSGISEINAAVSQLDQATQQNAAMFEETTAASHALTNEASVLLKAVSAFQTDSAQSTKELRKAS